VPKAIEVFGGKTCFYSLSNFIMSSSPKVTGGAGATAFDNPARVRA
jgi:hypothetical protein